MTFWPANSSTKLQIHESKESGVYVAGLREDIVTSAENVLHILDEGEGAQALWGDANEQAEFPLPHGLSYGVPSGTENQKTLQPCSCPHCLSSRPTSHAVTAPLSNDPLLRDPVEQKCCVQVAGAS